MDAKRMGNMIVVKLYKETADRREEVGRLEFFGVPLAEANGRKLVDFAMPDDEQCKGQVTLAPAGIATVSEIKAIVGSQCHDAKSH